MTVYFTSDSHFYHANIILPEYCNRPFKDIEEMNQHLIDVYNSTIGPKDILFHLGDFCFGNVQKKADILSRLKINMILILGNHDKESQLKAAGLEQMYKEAYIKVYDKTFWLHHIPLENRQGDSRYFRPAARMKYDYALSGHRHSKPEDRLMSDGCLDVGCDAWSYRPISIDEVLEEFRK